MDTSTMTKKELKEYQKQLKREEAIKKIRAQEKTPFLNLFSDRKCTWTEVLQLLQYKVLQ